MTAEDTFLGFVDLLAEALDDSDATSERLAAQLHLSRFHFDRTIASVAGEAPAHFRRRLLLERAAFRLVTTDHTILQVSAEAGYGSHEAFTRAFARAYGVRPSRWRERPTDLRIAAPSGVHFHPPGGIRLPTKTKVSTMNLLMKMLEHHIWLTGEFLRRAERLSDEQLDEVIDLSVDEDRQTLRTLLSRLVGQMGMWNAALDNRNYDWDIEDKESVTSMRRRLATEGPTYLANVRDAVDQDRLDDTFIDALCDPVEAFTYGGMIAHVLTFAAHRRTLVALALDHVGITDLGWGDPMRWVAELT